MRSVLQFLVFVLVAAGAVTLLYLWRSLETERDARGTASFAGLQVIDREFTSLVEKVLPSVVSINAIPANTTNPRLLLLQKLLGAQPGNPPPELGSGVIVSNDGVIVTNFHVVARASRVEVSLSDGRTVPARFLGGDAPSDIAILKIDAGGLYPISWGDSDAVKVGQVVLAVGNPLGLQETVTMGIISAKGRRATTEAANEYFQTDAAINRGNSGGPLINLRGELIGINNLVPAEAQGIAFAIPANTVRRVFESIRDHGRFIRPWFGLVVQPLTPELAQQLNLADQSGALVLMTAPGSPAEQAGLQPGDVIQEFNGRAVIDHVDLRNRMAEATIGETIPLKVLRGGKILETKVVIAADPQS